MLRLLRLLEPLRHDVRTVGVRGGLGDRGAELRTLGRRRGRCSSSTWTSRLNRKPTDSSLIPSIIALNMSKPSRWYSTSGSRWE